METYGVELEIEPGDSLDSVFKTAKEICTTQFQLSQLSTPYRPIRQNDDELPVIQEKER